MKRLSNFKSRISNFRRRAGFTLLEILVVVVIAGMMAAIAMPGFTRAMKGAQLRSAARTLSMAHKYARNTAVLRQVPMALLVDTVSREIEVVAMANRSSAAQHSGFIDERADRAEAAAGSAPSAEAAPPTINSEFIRTLGDKVTIQSVASAGGDDVDSYKGVYWVNYYPNGMCDGFRIELADEGGKSITVTAEGLSGSTELVWNQ